MLIFILNISVQMNKAIYSRMVLTQISIRNKKEQYL